MIFSGVLFDTQNGTEGNTKWYTKSSETEAKELEQMEFLKIDLVIDDMITHNESLFEILNGPAISSRRHNKLNVQTKFNSIDNLSEELGPLLSVSRDSD
jgi:hypothetical protein